MMLRAVQRFFGGGGVRRGQEPEEDREEGLEVEEQHPYESEYVHGDEAPEYLRGYLYRAEPRNFEDAGPIADCIKRGHSVVVNMEQADAAEGQRIRDFLRGAAYALGGDVRKVASRVYACVPAGVRIERLLSAVETGRQPQQARLSGGDPSDSEQGLWPE